MILYSIWTIWKVGGKVIRVQQIKIKEGHKLYPYFDDLTFKAKNLYNTANYYTRQCLTGAKKDILKITPNEQEILNLVNETIPRLNDLTKNYYNKRLAKEVLKEKPQDVKEPVVYSLITEDKSFLGYNLLEGVLKLTDNKDYKSLPGQVNQQVLKLLMRDWKSFFNSLKDYNKAPEKYKGRPKPPRYTKKDGRKVVSLSNQICNIKDNKYLKFPKTKESLNIGKLGLSGGKLKEVRVVPKFKHFIVELVMEYEDSISINKEATPKRVMAIDLGLNNLATIVNNIGERPIIIKGRALKSLNQYYNKKRAYYYGILRQGKSQKEGKFQSNKLNKLDDKRNAKVKDYLHKASRIIVNYAQEYGIDTIVIGKNTGWKTDINIGKSNNQNFVNIPHSKLIDMISYKAYEVGINIILTEESYTSKASFLDYDPIPVYNKDVQHKFSGKRITRGLYKTKDGTLVNADVNGALNIMIKAVPNAIGKRDRGLVDGPLMLSVA